MKVSVGDVCSQHRYETTVLPLARQYSWPTNPEFERLGDMVEAEPVFTRVVEVYIDPKLTVLIRGSREGWIDTRSVSEIISRIKSIRDAPRACG